MTDSNTKMVAPPEGVVGEGFFATKLNDVVGLVYRLSGLTPLVSETFIDKYKNGSKPDELTTQEEVNEIKALLTSTLDQTLVDYEEGKFKNYQEYQTKTGFLLKNLEDALQFNNYHEGIHLGFIMKIKKYI